MSETATKPKPAEEQVAKPAPAPSLPAVQDRRPRMPANRRDRAPVYSVEVAKAIHKITSEVGEIQKEGYNKFQDYKFVRWEDINEKLSPLFQKHGLILIQNEQSRNLLEENAQGSVLAIVYHFTWLHIDSGEQWPAIEWTGIARLRDQKGVTDDKAASKCATSAEKQFCIKQFKIVTNEGMPDADKTPTLPKKDARPIYDKLAREITAHTSVVELAIWGRENFERKKTLPEDWQDILTNLYNEKMGELKKGDVVLDDAAEFDDETGEIKNV